MQRHKVISVRGLVNYNSSVKHVLYVLTPEECGRSNPFGREKNSFRFVQVDGTKETILDEGIVDEETIHTGQPDWYRRVGCKAKSGTIWIDIPEPKPTPKTGVVTQDFKNLIAKLTGRA